ncbi:MAG: hypothetical protein V1644_02090, partial [Candidatus Micrarchaeota archaeon]
AGDMGCWLTSQISHSQPFSMAVQIPANATQVLLTVSKGRGDYPYYKLRECDYARCTTYGYFITNCPLVSSFGFGTSNLTSVLAPGWHVLNLDSIQQDGYASSTILDAVLDVSFPVLVFNATEKSCTYGENSTLCNASVSAQGTGACFYPSAASNVSIFRENSEVFSWLNNSKVYWNCSTGNYSINFNYLPFTRRQTWSFVDSNLSAQQLVSTIQISNPNNDSFTNIQFSFNSSSLENQSTDVGVLNLSALESKNISARFSGKVFEYNLSFSQIFFNFSSAFLSAYLTAVNNFSPQTPFAFSTGDLQLDSLNCESQNFSVVNSENFTILCQPQVNYSFSNWNGINATRVSSVLNLVAPDGFSVFVSNVSSKLSELFQLNLSVDLDNFFYSESNKIINLTSGDFISISLQNQSTIESDVLNYSISLKNPAGFQFNIPLSLAFPGYANISFANNSFASNSFASNLTANCQNAVCISGLFLNFTLSNQTNFSILASKPLQLIAAAVSQSSGSQGGGGGSGGQGGLYSQSPVSLNSLQSTPQLLETSPEQQENEQQINREEVPEQELEVVENETNLLPTASSAIPATGLFVFSMNEIALPVLLFFLLLCSVGALLFFFNKPALVSRFSNGGKVKMVVSNSLKSPMYKLILREILPSNAKVVSDCKACRKTKSVIGSVLTWKKAELKAREKWVVSYESDKLATRGKLCFVQNGKKHEKLFAFA